MVQCFHKIVGSVELLTVHVRHLVGIKLTFADVVAFRAWSIDSCRKGGAGALPLAVLAVLAQEKRSRHTTKVAALITACSSND